MSPLTPGGPGGKWLGKTGPLSAVELHEALEDIRAQLAREPAVLDALGEAILVRDLSTTSEISRTSATCSASSRRSWPW